MKRYITSTTQTKYYVIVDTKYVGRHKVELKAKNDEDAKKQAMKLANENNKIIKLLKSN